MNVHELLRAKYQVGQYALLFEVRDSAGFRANRSADAIAMGLWPSRGCEIEGFEIKVSRSDWQRELKAPNKAEAFVKYCDRWWIVAGDPAIVKLEELPPTWGLMAAKGSKLKILKPAPKLEPQPIDRYFLAAMLKRATDSAINSPEVKAHIDREIAAAKDRWESSRKRDAGETNAIRLENLNAQLQGAISEFEAAAGIKIHKWNAGKIGEAVHRLMEGEACLKSTLNRIGNVQRELVGLADFTASTIKRIESADAPNPIPEQKTA